MSELVPSVVPLDKGLNLQTAKIVAPPGSVLDCLNYEQVDFQGQKRIDGFARYDGHLLPAIDEYYKITATNFESAFVVGDLVAVTNGLMGVVCFVDVEDIYIAIINTNLLPTPGDSIFRTVDGVYVDEGVVAAAVFGVFSGVTEEVHYQNLLTFTQALRARVGELPSSIAGLHWFRDRLYAVADLKVISIEGITPVIYPNDIIYFGPLSEATPPYKVLDAITRANTRIVFLKCTDGATIDTVGTLVNRSRATIGSIAQGFEALSASEELATLFEARSEAQALEAGGTYNPGWVLIDQGWEVVFENGISLYGSLPSLNQNTTGLGTQGPTSTTGNNGRPLILNQKVTITDKQTQVNGWKSSQTPLSYQLETDNLIDVDTDTIYGDAYITWNGTTGEVIAPGYTTDPIPEYPATNAVVIEDIV